MASSIPKVFLAGGAVGFTYYLMMRKQWFPDPRLQTPATQAIEERANAGGAAQGQAGEKREEAKVMRSEQQAQSGVWPKGFYGWLDGGDKGEKGK
ncbi:hypothetical protein EJ04DRAFT_510064 [Polyplosphaeria fusca]|uniref:Uncharacterized protein n=1 Tax=Polyplosphaeria fusca TaxID=682080 RepID=A0A9P4R6T7_9PLEO|nr:hypothetical protein EJ04DRAFT_510064 [Polyplosphaeria fusca]